MSDRQELYEKVRALPHTPGVYLYKDRFNRVIYVGKARDLHRRVSQYFMLSKRTRADRKTRALLEHIWDLETHSVRTEAESLLLEGKLIKEYRPRYNVSFRDDKKFLLVKINMNDPYPRFILTRMRKDDGYRYYGPFAHSGSLRKTLELIQKKFHLRTCHPQVPGESDYRHCLQHIIKNCSAPCMGHISQQEYRARAEQACQFIEGASKEVRDELEQEMKEAAAALDFEKAAELRNLIEDLRRTTKPTRRFHKQFAPNIEPSSDMAELQTALDLPSLPDVIECFDISNISVTHKVASMVCFTDGKPDRKNYRRYRIKTVEGQDDFASMAEVVRRRYARVLKENYRQPKLIMVDGGKGQLGCARRELEELGLGSIPTIGLAKEREEIFRPGERDPIVLDHRTGGLRLLQRIRDEAHRTANGYHQLLMKQRINESILDDCPGISEARKKLLLKHFGSVDRLKHATVEQICEIEGVGPKLAESVVEFFANLKKKPIVEEIPAGETPEVVEMREVPGSKGKLKMDANGQVIYRLR